MTITASRPTTYDLGPAVALSCRECGARVDLGPHYACAECFGPLEVAYEFGTVTREAIEAGPRSIWRYRDLLPVPADVASLPGLDPGGTKLVRADNLARELGLRRLWVKDDSGNPTHSFKDRVVAVALAASRQLGFTVLACPSTGNLANAVAAAAARAGIRSVVLVPSNLERAKVITSSVYGGTLLAIDGTYDDVNRLAIQLAAEHDDWAFVNVNVRPYYAEGSKTLGFEVAEQLGWRLPDHLIAPMASGSMLVKIDKAFSELIKLELVEDRPWRISGAQATGCSPIAAAFKDASGVIRPVRPDTIAKSLAIGNPADGYYALDAVTRSNGSIEDVTDDEIVEGIRLLAETEGVFGETAGGVTVASLRKLVQAGVVTAGERTVAIISGVGLKTLDAVSGVVGPAFTITPGLEDFQSALTLSQEAVS